MEKITITYTDTRHVGANPRYQLSMDLENVSPMGVRELMLRFLKALNWDENHDIYKHVLLKESNFDQ